MAACEHCGVDSGKVAAMERIVEAANDLVITGATGGDVAASASLLTRALISYTEITRYIQGDGGGKDNALH